MLIVPLEIIADEDKRSTVKAFKYNKKLRKRQGIPIVCLYLNGIFCIVDQDSE